MIFLGYFFQNRCEALAWTTPDGVEVDDGREGVSWGVMAVSGASLAGAAVVVASD